MYTEEQRDFILSVRPGAFYELVKVYLDKNQYATRFLLQKTLDQLIEQQHLSLRDAHNTAVELETCLFHSLKPAETTQIIKNKLSNIRRSLRFEWDWLFSESIKDH